MQELATLAKAGLASKDDVHRAVARKSKPSKVVVKVKGGEMTVVLNRPNATTAEILEAAREGVRNLELLAKSQQRGQDAA